MRIKLAGVIYLHRISDIKMSGAMIKNLKMLKKLCGKNCYSKIVLATTMWDRVTDAHRAIQNEQQLGATHDWWGDLAEEGATIMRQDNGANSAMKIVEHIMSFNEPAVMENQIERVVKNLALEECESGKVIAEELIKQREEHERLMAEKREEYEALIKEGNARAAEKLARLEDKHRQKTDEMNRSQAALARKFEESNADLQRQISAHNYEMEEVRKARAQADEAVTTAAKELADFKAEQAKKEKQWKDARESDNAAFKKKMEDEQRKYVERESKITARIQQAVETAEESRRSYKSVWAVLGGVATSLVGAATLNPVLVSAGVAITAGGGSRAAYKASKG